jgi:hypothetical protein
VREGNAIVKTQVGRGARSFLQELDQFAPAFLREELFCVRLGLRVAGRTAASHDQKQQDAKAMYYDLLPQGADAQAER